MAVCDVKLAFVSIRTVALSRSYATRERAGLYERNSAFPWRI